MSTKKPRKVTANSLAAGKRNLLVGRVCSIHGLANQLSHDVRGVFTPAEVAAIQALATHAAQVASQLRGAYYKPKYLTCN